MKIYLERNRQKSNETNEENKRGVNMGDGEIKNEKLMTEAVKAKTGVSDEILSIIETRNSGFLISITRNVKVGRTAAEISTVKLEGHAKDMADAIQVITNIDNLTMQFIKNESAMYNIDLAAQPTKLSPVENK